MDTRLEAISENRMELIREPEMTKKTSTPTYPSETLHGHMWTAIKLNMATALRPSISGRYFGARVWGRASLIAYENLSGRLIGVFPPQFEELLQL